MPERVFHRVEMIEITEKFVEAVQGRQVTVEVAEMVLAELAGFVSLAFNAVAIVGASSGIPTVAPGLADRCQAGADRQFAGDEVGPAGGAAWLARNSR